MNAKCNLIIDSCCDLPFEVVDRPSVELLKFPYVSEYGERLDDLFVTRTAHDFYESMRKGEHPKTAQIPYVDMISAFERAIVSGVPTVYLAFSSGLSGNFETACMIRDKLIEENPSAELYLVDTKLASIAEGLLVYEAIRQQDRGLSAQELAQWAEEARFFVRSIFMIDDLEHLARGGRMPVSISHAGAKLDVKPLLGFDLTGKLTFMSVARGRKKAIRQMVDYYAKHATDTPGQRIIVGNADCPKDAERLMDAVTKVDETVPIVCANTGPVIGCHVGPGMLSMVFWGRDLREDLSVADRIALKIKGE